MLMPLALLLCEVTLRVLGSVFAVHQRYLLGAIVGFRVRLNIGKDIRRTQPSEI